MYLAPDGDEIQVADSAAKFLLERLSIERLHRPEAADLDESTRLQCGAMGWFALAISEDAGGSGLSAVEQALFARELGRQCAPVDILAQCLATMVVTDPGLRSQLAQGQHGVALLTEDGAEFRVLGSPHANFAVHATRLGSRVVTLEKSDLVPCPALDPANSLHRLKRLPEGSVGTSEGEYVWSMGQVSCTSMLVGIAEHALDLIVSYAKVRETFGRKIGSYQAVRHPCADMALRAEAARSQLWFAAAALKESRLDAHAHLDAAKHLANEAALSNTDVNIQLHGGIGITDEHNAHLLLKHALLLSRLFGTNRELLKRLLRAEVEN